MRRLARRLFTLCSATSLLLCVAVCVLWATSYPGHVLARDTVGGDGRTRRDVRLATVDGCLLAEFVRLRPVAAAAVLGTRPVGSRWEYAPANPADWMDGPAVLDWGTVGYGEGGPVPYAQRTGRYVVLRMWPVALLATVLPAIWARQYARRRHREHEGLCVRCGYDLRASPGRCPECGVPQGA